MTCMEDVKQKNDDAALRDDVTIRETGLKIEGNF